MIKPLNLHDTAAGVIERACDYVRKAQATSFTGIVLMAGTNDLETDEKIQQFNHCLVNLLSDVEDVNIISVIRCELRLFSKDGIHLSRRSLSLQAKIMLKKLYSVIN